VQTVRFLVRNRTRGSGWHADGNPGREGGNEGTGEKPKTALQAPTVPDVGGTQKVRYTCGS